MHHRVETPALGDSPKAHRDHLVALQNTAQSHGWQVVQDATMKMLDGSCLYDLTWSSRHYENYIFTPEWEYVEVGFKAYGQTKSSFFKRRIVHYAVMSVPLPRKLPNVVFDSLKHQNRQFRIAFDSKQLIKLEGNFNSYFATYYPNDYAIDTLSFITPEVMEALISARDYDIEIVNDTLLLFGPVMADPQPQLEAMSASLLLIRKKLLNNIVTYRDERVPNNEGRRIVAKAGMAVNGSSTQAWIAIAIFIMSVFSLPMFFLVLAFISTL